MGFLQRTLGTIYVEMLTRSGGDDIEELLQKLSCLLGSVGTGGRTSVADLLFQLKELS